MRRWWGVCACAGLAAVGCVEGGGVRLGGAAFEIRSEEVEGTTVAFVDADGDGLLDLLSAGERLSVRRGDGDWVRAGERYGAGENPDAIAVGDVDGDGDRDIVIANHEVHSVTVLLGDGRGGFGPAPWSPFEVLVDPHPHLVRLADLDGDGLLDLLVDHSPRRNSDPGLLRAGGGVLVMLGLQEGGFGEPGEVVESGGVPYRGFAVGDVNGDGKLDLVTPHVREAGVLLNRSGPGAIAFERAPAVELDTPFAFGLGDFDGDGWLDLLSASGEGSELVEVLKGDGRGGFERAGGSPFRLGRGGKNLIVGDFNGDGLADAAVCSYGVSDVLIVLGERGFGGAGGLESVRVPAGCEHPWGLASGDLNGDGRDELLIVGDRARSGRVYVSVPE